MKTFFVLACLGSSTGRTASCLAVSPEDRVSFWPRESWWVPCFKTFWSEMNFLSAKYDHATKMFEKALDVSCFTLTKQTHYVGTTPYQRRCDVDMTLFKQLCLVEYKNPPWGWDRKNIPRITVWHHEACRVMTNINLEGWIFLSHPHTINELFFLFTIRYHIFMSKEVLDFTEMWHDIMTSH